MAKDKDKTKKKRKFFNILPKSNDMALAMIVCGFAEVLFLMFLIALDILPILYLLAIVALLVIIDVVALKLSNSGDHHSTRSIGALVIIVLLLNVLLVGDYYIYSTYDTLNKISQEKDSTEVYKVITLAEGKYQNVNDIKGQQVNVIDMESKQLNEAKERLITKADVSYVVNPDPVAVGETLVNQNGTMQDNIIMVSSNYEKLIRENIEGFKDNTHTIYKIKVQKRANDSAKRIDVTKDSFNILISGIDVWGSIHKDGLSDVNMVVTINPEAKKILMTSIPRDSYVKLHSYNGYDKLTHTGIYGIEETKATIEDLLDIDINYTVRVNFAALVDLVNAIDGITVHSDYAFKSSISHWEYVEGENFLTGHSALYFARERKAFTDGDMQRNRQQQIVLEAIIKKCTSSKVILTRYTKILDAVEDNLTTDMHNQDMKRLVKMQISDMAKWDIKKYGIEGPTGGGASYCMGGRELSCVFPTEESIEKAKQLIHDTMYPVVNEDVQNQETTKSKN